MENEWRAAGRAYITDLGSFFYAGRPGVAWFQSVDNGFTYTVSAMSRAGVRVIRLTDCVFPEGWNPQEHDGRVSFTPVFPQPDGMPPALVDMEKVASCTWGGIEIAWYRNPDRASWIPLPSQREKAAR